MTLSTVDDMGPDAGQPARTDRVPQAQRYRVGAKGQVVIPKEHREALGLEPGDEVTFALVGGGDRVEVRRVASDRPLRGRFAGGTLAAELLDERRRDRDRDIGP